MMGIGEAGQAPVLGLVGWQWVFIFWGIPAVVLGIVVLVFLTDRPRQARWLSDEEREALESELAREKAEHRSHAGHMTVWQALAHPKVLLLAAAYFFVVTGNYGVEMYMASIFKDWYGLEVKKVAYLIVIPPIGSLLGQLFVGWNSDRTHERRWHATLPILAGAAALIIAPWSQGALVWSVVLFTVAMAGLKAYLPAFWALPSLLMTESAAAAAIGLINSFGNLGGWIGPTVVGVVKEQTNEYQYGLWFLAGSMIVSAIIIFSLRIGGRSAMPTAPTPRPQPEPEPATV
jgi:ACS family tartrate transporter-like MFS transporter